VRAVSLASKPRKRVTEAVASRMTRLIGALMRKNVDLFEGRNEVYGDSFVHFGPVMKALFPNGIEVRTVDDWNRVGVLVQMISKLTRYSASPGHVDSLRDLSVYAAILAGIEGQITLDGGELSPLKRPAKMEAIEVQSTRCEVHECQLLSVDYEIHSQTVVYQCDLGHNWEKPLADVQVHFKEEEPS